MSLLGKVVLVTGASSGIGEATAVACARAGASVAVAARRVDRLEQLAARVRSETSMFVTVHETDVADEQDCRRFVDDALRAHGQVDALVNNAGLMLLGPCTAPMGDWRRMVSVNIMGTLYATHAVLPIMLEQGSGDLVFLGSVLGRSTSSLSAAYCLTKFGVTAFADSLRKELAPTGVRVTTVEPGRVETELRQHITPYPPLADVFPPFPGLEASTIADAIVFAIGQPANAAVSEILIRPTVSVL